MRRKGIRIAGCASALAVGIYPRPDQNNQHFGDVRRTQRKIFHYVTSFQYLRKKMSDMKSCSQSEQTSKMEEYTQLRFRISEYFRIC